MVYFDPFKNNKICHPIQDSKSINILETNAVLVNFRLKEPKPNGTEICLLLTCSFLSTASFKPVQGNVLTQILIKSIHFSHLGPNMNVH